MNDAPHNPSVGARLQNLTIAVSVSEADDGAKLGFPDDQMDRVLEAVLTPIVSEGARVAYGGRLKSTRANPGRANYTFVIADRLGEAYRRLEMKPGIRPFRHFVSRERVRRSVGQRRFLAHVESLAPYGEVWIVDNADSMLVTTQIGHTSGRSTYVIGPPPETDAGDQSELFHSYQGLMQTEAYRRVLGRPVQSKVDGLSLMRSAMASMCDARLVVGGRRTGFSGSTSGVCEEALLTIRADRPLVVLGGFGGASRDIAIALGLLDASRAVPLHVTDSRDGYQSGMHDIETVRSQFEACAGEDLDLLKELADTDSLTDTTERLVRFFVRSSTAPTGT